MVYQFQPNETSYAQMKRNEIVLKCPGSQKANGTGSILGWFQTGYFFRVPECNSLREMETKCQLNNPIERLEAS